MAINTYSKFAPNVFVAKCTEKHEKGDIITLTTKYGKENEHIVHNLVKESNGYYFYSITRLDGFNSQEWAKRKAEQKLSVAANAKRKGDQYYEASNRHRDFLSLGEPIKVGHHSEKRHRKIIEDSWNNMGKFVEQSNKAKEYEDKAAYYESKANEINLSMPESIEFFKYKLDQAKEYHQGLKDGKYKRQHSFSLTYAKKEVNNLTKKLELAQLLWA